MPSQDVFTPYTTKHRKHWAVLQGLSPGEHRELVRRLWLILASGVMESSNEVSRFVKTVSVALHSRLHLFMKYLSHWAPRYCWQSNCTDA